MSPELHALVERYLLPLQLLLAMLGMGATLRVADFLQVARHPKALAIGLALQLVLVPLIGLGFVFVFGLTPGWAVGLLLVAVVPGGTVSNLFTHVAKGNSALSVTVTAVTTLVSVASIPILLPILTGGIDIEMPTGQVVRDIVLFLLLPLVAGMAVLRFLESRAPAVSRWAIRASLFCVGVIVISALGSGRIEVDAYGWVPPLIIIAFGVTLSLLTPQLCRLLGRPDPDTVALTIEVVVRNIGIALFLVRFFFPDEPEQAHVLYTCLFYSGASFFISLPIIIGQRRGQSPALFRRPFPGEAQ